MLVVRHRYVLSRHLPTSRSHIRYPAAPDAFPRLAQTHEKLELDTSIVGEDSVPRHGVVVTISLSLCIHRDTRPHRTVALSLHGRPLLDHLQYLFPVLDGDLS